MQGLNVDQERLDTLVEINSLINSNFLDLNLLLSKIVESASRLVDGEAASLLLYNSDSQKLHFEVALGIKAEEVRKFSLKIGEGIAGWVVQNSRALIVNDVAADERFQAEISRKVGFPAEAILAVPMFINEECIGVIEIINKINYTKFNEEDLRWLEVFSTQAGIAIVNARAFAASQHKVKVLTVNQVSKTKHFVAEDSLTKEKLDLSKRVAMTDSSILLLGESGVGKELFAEQIHTHSSRREEPFIRVNCAAIPSELLESELFGHVRGAFTGAIKDRRGKFELSNKGTLLLDEIGELPIHLQPKLLRVLQNGVFDPVGGTGSKHVDVRIIASTNKDIEKEVQLDRFRADLYYRLNVLPIYIPPLRERTKDIEALACHFLKIFSAETKKKISGFSIEALKLLQTYRWPGNIRELENCVERAVVLTQSKIIQVTDLLLNQNYGSIPDATEEVYKGKSLREAVNAFKRRFIRRSLEENGWKQTKTSQSLKIQRTYLSRLIKELGINS